MTLGLKRGTVALFPHEKEWETVAQKTVLEIKEILADGVFDVQHVGSTSIKSIPAKPIIDIAVCVYDYEAVIKKNAALEKRGIIFRQDGRPEQLLYVKGDLKKDFITHHIHVVLYGSREWENYIFFRDRLNSDKEEARRYCELKRSLAKKYALDRESYTAAKSDYIKSVLNKADNTQNK